MPKEERGKTAGKRFQLKIKELWKRTKEGGIFVIVEDGTGGEDVSGDGCSSGASAAVSEAGSGSCRDGFRVDEGRGSDGRVSGPHGEGARVPLETATTEGAAAGSAARQGAGPAAREPTVTRKTKGAAAAAARVKQGAAAAPRATRAAHARRAAAFRLPGLRAGSQQPAFSSGPVSASSNSFPAIHAEPANSLPTLSRALCLFSPRGHPLQ